MRTRAWGNEVGVTRSLDRMRPGTRRWWRANQSEWDTDVERWTDTLRKGNKREARREKGRGKKETDTKEGTEVCREGQRIAP